MRLFVRDGEISDQGEWIYAWLHAGRVVHLGATTLHPATRTWLHLNDADPGVGRIAARLPDLRDAEFEVVARQLPPNVPRAEARQAAIAEAMKRDLVSDRYVGFEPTNAEHSDAVLTEARALCDLIDSKRE